MFVLLYIKLIVLNTTQCKFRRSKIIANIFPLGNLFYKNYFNLYKKQGKLTTRKPHAKLDVVMES